MSLGTGESCRTPCSISLKRRHDVRADYSLEGYRPVYVLMQSRTGGAAAGNILLGGLIGGVVDGANGASNHLDPNPVNVKLTPIGSDTLEVLIDKKGNVSGTVLAHNDKVRQDVSKTIGVEAAGLASSAAPNGAADAAQTPASKPAAEVDAAPSGN